MLVRLFPFFASFGRTPILAKIWRSVVGIAIYGVFVAFVEFRLLHDRVDVSPNIHTMLGLALGVFLVFRTNTAYDRWWEGRKLWGQLVNDCRNLAIKAKVLAGLSPDERLRWFQSISGVAHAIKLHLRDQAKLQSLAGFESHSENPRHVVVHLVEDVYAQVREWHASRRIDSVEFLILDAQLQSLLNVCGGCERIKKTPLADSYLAFIRQCIGLYLITLPWGLVRDLDFWTVPTTVIVAYFMLGIEYIAEAVEEPFGSDEDDLKLDEIVRGIDESVSQVLLKQ